MMRLLNLDVETRPGLAWVWDLRDRYIVPERLIEPKRILCFAGKWVGEEEIFFFSEWDDSREYMIRGIWDLLDRADAVLHYNGTRFDIPMIQTEFAVLGLPPPSPFQQVDLYKAAKKSFAFMSNRLDQVTKMLGTTRKLEHEGFSLWTKAIDGDPDAQRRMEEYNTGDLAANEDLYDRLLPWIQPHPNRALTDGDCCPQCGRTDFLRPQGYAYTATGRFQRWRCDSCGKWLRSGHRAAGVDLRGIS